MEESIALIAFIVIGLLMLSLFLQVQADISLLQIQLMKETEKEAERVKEKLEMSWLGRYHAALANEGSRHVNLSALYVYTENDEVPSRVIDLNEEVLLSGYSRLINLLPILVQEGETVLLRSDNHPSVYFEDDHFLYKDYLVFGPVNYSLFRNLSDPSLEETDPNPKDLDMEINSFPLDTSGKKWTVCFWLRVGSRAYDILNKDDDIDGDGELDENDDEYCKDHDSNDCLQIIHFGDVRVFAVKDRNGFVRHLFRIKDKELASWWDATDWVHLCLVKSYNRNQRKYIIKLFINGETSSELKKKFDNNIIIDTIRLKGTRCGYSIDELIIISGEKLSGSEIRLLGATGLPPPGLPNDKYIEFSFESLDTDVIRLDFLTDLGVRYNFTRPEPKDGPYIVSMPEMEPVEETEPWGSVWRAYMGPVPPTALVPLWTTDVNWHGEYMVLFSEDYAVWNVNGYDLHLEITDDFDGTAGDMLQIIRSADLVMRPARVWSQIGYDITVPMVRIDDGQYLEVIFRVDTLSLVDLARTGDKVTGKVVWSSTGLDFTPENGWWTKLYIVAIETGDSTQVNDDGTFELTLTKSDGTVTLGIFFPEEFYTPGFRGYMVPYSGTYIVGG